MLSISSVLRPAFSNVSLLLIASLIVAGCANSARAKRVSKHRDSLKPVPSDIAKKVKLERIHRGLSKPLGLEYFSGDPLKRLFVVEQTGKVLAIEKGVVQSEALLDLSKKISTSHSEQGLLGLAFHPNFLGNGFLYVNYTDKTGTTIVSRFSATKGTSAKVDPSSELVLLRVDQPWRNHNGGYLEFGPDKKLYVGMGDGGAGGDPKRASQDPSNLLGKMLRIDVGSKKVETVQSGLRNPWRFTFDRSNGDLYIADVGQDKWEEINVVAAKDIDGANFGWSTREGKHCFGKSGCTSKGLIEPVIEFDHATGCSITGGVVYRGKAIPSLAGTYFYSDFCTAILRSFQWSKAGVEKHWNWKKALDPRYRLANVSAFAEDEEGEVYLLSLDGVIYKFLPAP
ncbi:MAG: PQQ-dependent sugar dehydrogenase [Kofleriaceae bacterium]|nr:PQQ-dependent sugar dehydrogenase [Kofleriaceae bacterium]